MKKLLSLLLAFVILLSTTGCKKIQQSHSPNQQTTTTPSTEDTTISAGNTEIQQKPIYAISLIPQVEETTDGNGKVRFKYAYQNLSLVLPEPEVADKIILDYLNRMDQADEYAASVREDSLSDVYDTLPYLPLFYNIEYIPSRFDTNILSYQMKEVIYLGGVHPDHIGRSATYNLLTGDRLQLSDVLSENITSESIANTVIDNLSDAEELWPNYKEIVYEQFDHGLDKFEHWYFTEEGLAFHFDPYVLASFASGTITVVLPYNQLTGILKDEYFPAEEDSYKGSLIAEKFTVDAQKDYTQFAEAVLVEEGTKILLSADGVITDITIQAVTITDGSSNLSGTTVMVVQSLTPGDALMVEFDSATTKLFVSYHSGDQTETKTIAHSNDTITIS